MELEAIGAARRSDRAATGRRACNGRDWPIKIVAVKYNAVEAAFRIADTRARCLRRLRHVQEERAGAAVPRRRAGRFHPANSSLTHEIVGKIALGINPDEPPRWG